jgi:hypothetical protein
VVETHFKETTVISIAHRLNFIRGADKILVQRTGPHPPIRYPPSAHPSSKSSVVTFGYEGTSLTLRETVEDRE